MRRIIAMLLAIVMLVGNVPVQAFATEDALQETAACITEGCTYGAGHTGECSNFVPCGTEGCTYASGHEGNCSNYVAPPEPEAEPAGDAVISVTVSDRGQLALACEEVTVSDVDRDGSLSLDEALYAAHTAFGKAYASEEGTVTKLWDVSTTDVSFFINHKTVSSDVSAVTVSSGDYLVASVDRDAANDSDMYSRFTELEKTVKANESFTLNLTDEQGNPLAGMEIGLWNGDGSTTMLGLTTDVSGSVSLTLDQEGLYCVTAAGTVVETAIDLNTMEQTSIEAPILAPVCVVTVSGVAQKQESVAWSGRLTNNAVAAIDAGGSNDVNIYFSVVDAETGDFIISRRAMTVSPGTGAAYGWLNDEAGDTMIETSYDHSVSADECTPIDALIQAHELMYGGSFTEATISSYLSGSSDYVTGFFERLTPSGGIGFKVNGQSPTDGDGCSYAANEYVLQNGDELVWLAYSSWEYCNDYFAYFTNTDGTNVHALTVEAGTPVSLVLKGMSGMWGVTEAENLGYIEILLAEPKEDGFGMNLTGSVLGSTGEGGVFTHTFDTAGEYCLSAKGPYTDMYGTSCNLIMPLSRITVTAAAPTVIAVERVSLNKSELTLEVGGNETLTATVYPDNAADKTVTWSSSNTAVATVAGGVVTAGVAGEAIITAAAGGKTASCAVTVNASAADLGTVRVIIENTTYEGAPFTGTLVDVEIPLTEDMTMMTAILTALKENGYTWSGTGATYDDGMDITYLSTIVKGSETLGEFTDGGYGSGWKGTLNDWFVNRGFDQWTVKNGDLKDGDVIRVMYTRDYGADIGGEYGTNEGWLSSLSASEGTLSPAFAQETLEYTLTVDESIGSLNITAVAANKEDKVSVQVGGTEYRRGENVPVSDGTRITVACDDREYTVTVCVENPAVIPVTGVSLDRQELDLTVGDTASLEAVVTPADATDKTVTWTTSNAAVAQVFNGTVTAAAPGTAIITASVGSLTATCEVTVAAAAPSWPFTISVNGEVLEVTDLGTTEECTKMYYTAKKMEITVPAGTKTVTVNGVVGAVYLYPNHGSQKIASPGSNTEVAVSENAYLCMRDVTEGGWYHVAVKFAPCENHDWTDATCSAPKTCSVCGATEGEADPEAHSYVDGTCEHCGEAEPVSNPFTLTAGGEVLTITNLGATESCGCAIAGGTSNKLKVTVSAGTQAITVQIQGGNGYMIDGNMAVTSPGQSATHTVTGAEGDKICLGTLPGQGNGYHIYIEVAPCEDHDWTDATCKTPKTCTVCGATEGEANPDAHSYVDGTCEHCGAEEPLSHHVALSVNGEELEVTDLGTTVDCTLNYYTAKQMKVIVPAGTKEITVSGVHTAVAVYFNHGSKQVADPSNPKSFAVSEDSYLCLMPYSTGNYYHIAIKFAPCEDHDWTDATCTAPKTCSVCGATDGAVDSDAHNYVDGECEYCGEAKPVSYPFTLTAGGETLTVTDLGATENCSCGNMPGTSNKVKVTVPAGTKTIAIQVTSSYFVDGGYAPINSSQPGSHTVTGAEGEKICLAALPGQGTSYHIYIEVAPCENHDWQDATCKTPKTCSVCGATEGEADPDAHSYVDGICEHCGEAEPVSYPFNLTAGGETLAITDLGTTSTCTKTNMEAKEMSVTVPAGTTAVTVSSVNNSIVMMYPDHGDQQIARNNGSVDVNIDADSYLCLTTAAERILYHIAVEYAPCENHDWNDATCKTPKTCSVCGATEGEADPDAHSYVDGTCEHCGEAEPISAPAYTIKLSEAEELTEGLNYFASIPAEGMNIIVDFGGGKLSGGWCYDCNGRILTAGEGSTFVVTAEQVAAHYFDEDSRAEFEEDFDIYLTEDSQLVAFYFWTTSNTAGSYIYIEILPAEEACTHENWLAATCKTPKTCSVCGATEGEADPDAHSYVDGTCEHCGEAEPVTPAYTIKLSEAEVLSAGLNYFISVPAEGMDIIFDFGGGTISGTLCQRHCSMRNIHVAGEGSTLIMSADTVAAHLCNESQRSQIASDFGLYLTEGSKMFAFYWWTSSNRNGSYIYIELLPAEGGGDQGGGEEDTYNVTLPTNTVGYSVRATSSTTVAAGGEFSFKLNIYGEYKKSENFRVMANDVELTSSGDTYTITNITKDQTVTVEGVVEKTLAEKNVTVIAPAGSTVSSGSFHSYFIYDFSEPLEVTTLDDGRVQYVLPVLSGNGGFIRVQHPDGVTYWDFGGQEIGKVFDITKEMLFIGSSEFTKETVYANFEKNIKDKADLYLTANEKGWLDLASGETWNLNVFRNFLSLGNSVSNTQVALPDVEYTVVTLSGSDVVTVTPDANNSSYAEIRAENPGTAIILVSYDAVYNNDGEGGKQWSAIWPENTGVIIVTVDAADASIATNMTVNEEANGSGKQVIDAEHDILFYVGSSGASYSFKPEAGCTVTVNRSSVGSTMTFGSFTDSGVEVAEDGTVTVSGLTTGAHIIRVEKDGAAVYQVIRARQVSYELKHSDGSLVTAESPAKPGETVTVQFHNLISPMEKLSGVYNANFGFWYNGEDGTQIRTSGGTYGVYYFSGSTDLQRFSFTVPATWNKNTYTLTDGAIKLGGFGSSAGAHRSTTYIEGKDVNMNASGIAGALSVLPDITLPVLEQLALNKTSLAMEVGETETLTARGTLLDDTATWASSNTAVAKVEDGVVTAQAAGEATITVAVGEVTATCVVTVTADRIAAEAVEKLIKEIGEVTLDSEEAIEAARAAYEELTDAQKALVENYEELTAAEAALEERKTEAANQAAADSVSQLIEEIGEVTLDSEEAIEAARAAYEELTDAQKALVENYEDLTAAETALITLKDRAAANEVINLIEAIDEVTKDSQEEIEAARTAYEALTDAQKAMVTNLDVLEAAEEVLQLLNRVPANIADIYTATGNYLAGKTLTMGQSNGEWAALGLARSGRTVAAGYYDAVAAAVKSNRIHEVKSTENARVILALTAIGKDVTDVSGHDLLAGLNEMSYITKQGLNGPIWTLIALDSHGYEPAGDVTREKLLQTILDAQLSDGGWSLSTKSDVDMTAMAVQALAPYYGTNAAVKTAVDKALTWLSQAQNSDGSFGSVDGANAESIAQVIVALTALGIDPDEDTRFIKNSITTVQALAQFYVEGGGFEHVEGTGRNDMATEQGYYALAAYTRFKAGQTALYDMSDVTLETDALNQAAAAEVITLINAIGTVDATKEDEINAARTAYNALTDAQKALVTNYSTLTAAETRLAELTGTPEDREKVENVKSLIDAIGTVTLNSESAITAARSAYNALTTKQQNLLGSAYQKKLTDAESALAALKKEQTDRTAANAVIQKINAIGSTVTLSSEAKITAARTAYNALTADQKTLVTNYQTLVNAENALNQLKSTVSVTFSLLGCYKHGSNETSVHTLAGGNLQTWIPAKTYKVQPGATVKDLFEQALSAAGLTWSNPTGNYVESITYNGQTVGEFTNGTNSGWMYTLNGKHPNLGVAQQTLVNGDVVVFHYTDDYTKEEGRISSGTTGSTTSSGTTNYVTTTTTQTNTAAAEAVDRLIEDIGQEITLDSAAKIKAARAAYDKLTDAQKKLVKKYEDLVAAEQKLAELKGVSSVDVYAETGDYLENLGTPGVGAVGGEWMVIGLARSGRTVATGYYDHVLNYVRDNINGQEQLHSAKSSDNSRVILALTAIGKDVTNVAGHDLLKGLNSMEYIQKQGINGPIWALIAFDSGNYPVPQGDVSREKLVNVILEAQLSDGGWAMSGERSDPDLTGMAIQALVPYMESNPAVKQAVEDAVWALSKMQNDNGSFSSVDGPSSESIAQVIVALAALGIDADTDARFVKNGISAMDALLTYFVPGGGFRHVLDGNMDGMATEQAYYALVAYNRMKQNQNFLYDMTDVIDRGGDVVVEETVEPTEMATEPVQDAEEDNGNTVVIWTAVMVLCAGAIVVILLNRKKLDGKFL